MQKSSSQLAPTVFGDDGHRIAHRHKTFEPMVLVSVSGEARAHLLNVSETGALIHMANPPESGSMVSVDLGHMRANGRVVWTNGSRLGVAFNNRLEGSTIERVLRA